MKENELYTKLINNPQRCIWPFEDGVEHEKESQTELNKLTTAIDIIPVEELHTPAKVGRYLGAEVKIARLIYPRSGFTWFRNKSPLIEVASWLSDDYRQIIIAHEVCHVLLGPQKDEYYKFTERICNWGAGTILGRIRNGVSAF